MLCNFPPTALPKWHSTDAELSQLPPSLGMQTIPFLRGQRLPARDSRPGSGQGVRCWPRHSAPACAPQLAAGSKRLPVCRAAWRSRLSRLPSAPSCLHSPAPAGCPSPSSSGVCAVPAAALCLSVSLSPGETSLGLFSLLCQLKSPAAFANSLETPISAVLAWGMALPQAGSNPQRDTSPPGCATGCVTREGQEGRRAGRRGVGGKVRGAAKHPHGLFRRPPGCRHREPAGEKPEFLEEKRVLGPGSSWICGAGEGLRPWLAALGSTSPRGGCAMPRGWEDALTPQAWQGSSA